MQKLKFFILLFLLFGFKSFSQLQVESLHYLDQIENSLVYGKDLKTNHSSILPSVNTLANYKKGYGRIVKEKGVKRWQSKIYPIANLSVGYESKSSSSLIYDTGIGLGLDISSNKLFFTGKILPYFNNGGYIRDSIQTVGFIDPATGRPLIHNLFQQNEIILAYRPNQFFTFLGGHGKNFFGEGYRSLLLSDNAAAQPFLKVETSFSGLKFVNLYQMWRDNTANSVWHKDTYKFTASHYLSWNITREFNLSVFETVIWQANDSLHNRGFDPNYLNPVVFYRPVEYGSGSADNVLLGANMTYKFNQNHALYFQFILDDFLLSEIRARSRWWANKYGTQIGYKTNTFFGKESFYFQGEFNLVRPFTYSHNHSSLAYGNLNASVAHPIGSNFMEVLSILSYPIKKVRITNQLSYLAYGADSSAVSYGQNIFKSYGLRDKEYDHYMLQGDKYNVINERLTISFPIISEIDLYFNFIYNWRASFNATNNSQLHSLQFGIQTRIWNRYTDI
ncbi:hypothetical protein [Crocinitomix algicola]|uniref:hypothetical protein n=1 Tax=Crocinitomix algicola TaxID=1740263 RepID=UPI001112D59A|nr:hypothetical protein [Crocinitomix algicola]